MKKNKRLSLLLFPLSSQPSSLLLIFLPLLFGKASVNFSTNFVLSISRGSLVHFSILSSSLHLLLITRDYSQTSMQWWSRFDNRPIIRILAIHSNKLVLNFATCILYYIFIHDYSYRLHVECYQYCQKEDNQSLIDLLDTSVIVELITHSHDMVIIFISFLLD